MNTTNSKTKHSDKFVYNFTDKLKLKNPIKNIALANLSIYYTWKNSKSDYNITINLKYQHPRGMIRLYTSISLKNMKLLLMFLQG